MAYLVVQITEKTALSPLSILKYHNGVQDGRQIFVTDFLTYMQPTKAHFNYIITYINILYNFVVSKSSFRQKCGNLYIFFYLKQQSMTTDYVISMIVI